MAQKTRAVLKEYFETGDIPTEPQFIDLIDSLVNIVDDSYEERKILTSNVVDYIPDITELLNYQSMINTADKIMYVRVDNDIFMYGAVIAPNFTIIDFLPNEISEQSTGNAIDVEGTKFVPEMTVNIPDQNGLTFSNVSLNLIDDENLVVYFDVAGDITSDTTFNIYLSKYGYIAHFIMNADVDLEITADNVGGLTGKSASEVVRFTVNEDVIAFTGANTNNANVTVNSVTKISDTEVDVDLDTSAATWEEAFSIRVTGDGETTPYYAMAVAYTYVEFLESGDLNLDDISGYDSITGWDRINNTSLFFECLDSNKIYAYLSDADRTTGTSASVFYVEFEGNTVIEQNSSGFGGTMIYTGATPATNGTKSWVHAPGFTYTEVDETGDPATECGGYEQIEGWNRLENDTLYFYIYDNDPLGMYIEFYDNAVSRDARTPGDILAFAEADTGSVNEQNGSGFCGSMIINAGLSDGDKMYVIAS